MKPCKAKPTDGKPCPNQVDKGQEYCPYHLAKQVAEKKTIFSIIAGALSVLGLVGTGIYKVAKFIVTKKL